ncbi:MAG TPA: CoA-binding protein [Nocardioides sp.]|nr:CoA-binding protein [Nocardioides sp.]
MTWQDPESIRYMLDDCEVWAVVGLSGDRNRTAYSIASLLQQRGKRIVPIAPDEYRTFGMDSMFPSHPAAATDEGFEVLGEKGYATLADVPFPIDVVDVFRRSEAAGEFADQAVAVGAKAVWFQLGVIDAAAFERTVAAGVPMAMDTCPAIEWRRRA